MKRDMTLQGGERLSLSLQGEPESISILIETPSIIAAFDHDRLPEVCEAFKAGKSIYASSGVPPLSSVSREGDELVLEFFEFEPFVQRYVLTEAEWNRLAELIGAYAARSSHTADAG